MGALQLSRGKEEPTKKNLENPIPTLNICKIQNPGQTQPSLKTLPLSRQYGLGTVLREVCYFPTSQCSGQVKESINNKAAKCPKSTRTERIIETK